MQLLAESELADEETLDLVVYFLKKKYPHLFVKVAEKPEYLRNCITDLEFKIEKPYEMHSLEVASQLVMEDLNILMQGCRAARPVSNGNNLRGITKRGLKYCVFLGGTGWVVYGIDGKVDEGRH